jgi:type IV fimbrial biogenesis protein FimT
MDDRGLYNMNMGKTKGFTLVELLITIVVLTIVIAMGVPSIMDFTKNNRLTTQANDLVLAVQVARSEGLKRGSGTTICASTNQTSCNVTNKDWKNGWIVFSDLDQDGTPDVGTNACLPAEDCMLRTSTGLAGAHTLTATVDRIRYLPTGMPMQSDLPLSGSVRRAAFTLKSSDCKRNQARTITVTQQGHTVVSSITCP